MLRDLVLHGEDLAKQVTLVGRTGAGKSTVFKLLLGLYQPKAGTDHHRRRGRFGTSRIASAARCIGCVEQHFARVPGTVLDQITLGDPRITPGHGAECGTAGRAGRRPSTRCPPAYDTPCTRTVCSLRANGSCSPSPARRRPIPPCFCWTRSRRTLTRKRKRGCWRRSAARPSGGRCSPFLIASMKNLAAGSSRSKRWTRENKEKRLLSLKT